MTAHAVEFMHLTFWVQVWGLPFDHMTEDVARDIGLELGSVIMVDDKPFDSD